ncbi:MAG: T9SS type A sorting domain-containing protein [bacterium]|nr:T9SS type A sorting domain-containing protein [bacterium]
MKTLVKFFYNYFFNLPAGKRKIYLPIIIILAMLHCITMDAQQNFMYHPDDVYWSYQFGYPGLFNRARVVAPYNSTTMVFAGNFELPNEQGEFESYLLAFWDGVGWRLEGPGHINDFNSEFILDMCVVGTDIYIGGNFTTLNTANIQYLARWDGSQWSAVGTGVNGAVYALETDGNFNLYAGGDLTMAGGITAYHIAKWDGNNWSALLGSGGGNGVNGRVRSIAIGNTGVYVGGDFTIAGGTIAYFAALYNTAATPDDWQDLDIIWTIGNVSTIDVVGEKIFIGGGFHSVNGWPGDYIVQKDGAGSWEAMGSGSDLAVQKLIATTNAEVFAIGDFRTDAGPAASLIAKWNGSAWEALGDEPFYQSGDTYDIAMHDPYVLYTTRFEFQNPNYLLGNGIYEWDGTSWSGLGNGMGDHYWTTTMFVSNLEWYDSKLFVAGNFSTAGDKRIQGLAQFDGDTWSDVGGGSQTPFFFVNDLLVNDNKLYAGGYFTSMGGSNANYIAAWDGNSWSALGTSPDNTVQTIHAIGTDIYASGNFFNAGGVPATFIARWDGVSWHPLANGGVLCNAMANIGNDLYAGGSFTLINGGTVSVNGLARWDGSNWFDVGGGVSVSSGSSAVYALAVRNNELIVGGNFTMAGSIPANNIAIWNGSQWSALGDGLNGQVRAILVNGDDIYAGGQFTIAGGDAAFSIAKWDGSDWQPLGKGIHQANNFIATATVYSLKATPEGLFVGGQFTHAGDKYSNMIALYTDFTTDIKEVENQVPLECRLEQNYPNPFNPSTTIQFSIPEQSFVKLEVFNTLGEKISTLVSEELNAGNYTYEWNAEKLSSGIYYYKLSANEFSKANKMILLK